MTDKNLIIKKDVNQKTNSDTFSLVEKKIELIDSSNVLEFKKRMYEYRDFLIEMDLYFDKKKDTDLLSVRDELLGDVNQFLYLLSFTK